MKLMRRSHQFGRKSRPYSVSSILLATLLIVTAVHLPSGLLAVPSPTPSASTVSDPSTLCGMVSGGVPGSLSATDFSSLGEYCQALSLLKEAQKFNIASTVLFSIASVPCLETCFLLDPVAATMCTVLGTGAEIADVSGEIKLTVDGRSFESYWQDHFDIAGIALGTTGDAAALGLGGLRAKGLAGDKTTRGLSCAAGVLFATTAILKGVNIHSNQSSQSSTKTSIVNLGSKVVPLPTSSSSLPAAVTASGGGNSTVAALSASEVTDLKAAAASATDFSSGYPSALMQAASAGNPVASFLNQLPNVSQMPEALTNAGTSAGALGSSIASGTSPASAISNALPSGGSAVKEQLAHLEQLAHQGRLTAQGLGTPNGRPGSQAAHLKLDSNFFSGSSAPTSGPPEVSFQGTTPSDANDIWHSTYRGTLFSLASRKLLTLQGRVVNLEWVTPLNRALNGLRPQPTTPPPSAKGTREGYR